MANSIKTMTKTEYYRNGVLREQIPTQIVETETTSDLRHETIQIVGTTHELISVGDVTDDAFAEIENLHATAIVSVGHEVAAAFVGLIDIPPGTTAVIPLMTTLATTYLDSDTASTPVRVKLVKIVAPA